MAVREKITGYFRSSSGSGDDGEGSDRVQNRARVKDGAEARSSVTAKHAVSYKLA